MTGLMSGALTVAGADVLAFACGGLYPALAGTVTLAVLYAAGGRFTAELYGLARGRSLARDLGTCAGFLRAALTGTTGGRRGPWKR